MQKLNSIEQALGHTSSDKRIEILRFIGTTGSISQAAREAGVSYKAAWQAIDTLTNLAGINLVERAVGGAGGGGASLTEAGLRLLSTAELLESIRGEVLAQLRAGNESALSNTFSQLAIRTSMRNHLPCQVSGLTYTGQQVRVLLDLPGGEQIASRITRASAELLGLTHGQSVLALFKATAVTVGRPGVACTVSGMNYLEGRVERISHGDIEDEVVVTFGGGLQLVGFAPTEAFLKKRNIAAVTVEESGVVIALTG